MTNDLSIFKANDRQILKQLSQKKGGRPHKSDTEKMCVKVTINFTRKEKQKLVERSQSQGGLPITTLIRNLLVANQYI